MIISCSCESSDECAINGSQKLPMCHREPKLWQKTMLLCILLHTTTHKLLV